MSFLDLDNFSLNSKFGDSFGMLCSWRLFESVTADMFREHPELTPEELRVEFETFSEDNPKSFDGNFQELLDEWDETLEEFLEDTR